jgi:predicted metal-binding protein
MPLPITEVIVCTTCRPAGAPRDQPAAGEALLEAVQTSQFDAEPGERVVVRGVACMSGCDRACTVAFQAPGKHSYLFGDLQPDADTAAQVLACARLHAHSADGALARSDRPARLRSGILTKLPPYVTAADGAP